MVNYKMKKVKLIQKSSASGVIYIIFYVTIYIFFFIKSLLKYLYMELRKLHNDITFEQIIVFFITSAHFAITI